MTTQRERMKCTKCGEELKLVLLPNELPKLPRIPQYANEWICSKHGKVSEGFLIPFQL